ncbi:tudor domain-containing protein [Dermatophagoides farinae]|uniref:Tudor domain-containing protein n=1 Tax=Dermatophagoides farinae TaxID=6954 RepID=A0A9D4SHB5_DERFA|nr:uncharacterized protein LOC124493083 [Dermatophagoides farinae]KAH7641646.1 tudor domain-containing protein [Dermatophagoides farinae]
MSKQKQDHNCMTDESVIVTHVNSPTLFYCRVEQDVERYEQLTKLIRQHIDSEPHSMPDLIRRNSVSGSVILALVYSDIHKDWCRARLISMKCDRNHKPICGKVLLIDFGSIEFVSWKSKFVSTSTLEIDDFNESRGLCFPCSLDNIKPYDDVKLDSEKPLQYEWTSYANFMFKKETTNGKFLLKVMKPDLLNDKIIVCDLLPMNDCSKLDEFPSLSQYLVDSKVARYINVSNF